MAALTNVHGTVKLTSNIQLTPASGFDTNTDLNSPLNLGVLFRLAGQAADQCDLVYAQRLSFSASTPQTIDLQNFTDRGGATGRSFARVRFVAIRVRATTDTWVLLVGGAASNEWLGLVAATGILKVYPASDDGSGGIRNDGFTVFTAPNTTGMAVGGSNKSLKLDPGSHAFDVDLVIAGCSA